MAALLWTYHVLSPSDYTSSQGGGVLTHCTVYARPSCAQVVRGPTSDIADSHRKDCGSPVHYQHHKPFSHHASISRESSLRHSRQETAKFGRKSTARRIGEFPLEGHLTNSIEVASPYQRVRRNRRLPVVEARTGAGEGVPAIRIPVWKGVSLHALGALLVGTMLFGVSPAQATDALKTCACLLKECSMVGLSHRRFGEPIRYRHMPAKRRRIGVELARCIADPGCAANVACLQTCNNRPDETECQIGCGDLFENQVVDQFNDCAVSKKGCVPQKKDEGLFPVPPPGALVQDFNPQDFTGKWYITSGLNRTFDTFDCQLHEFSATPNTLTGKLNWRIATPDGGFFTRSAVQNFIQKENQPGVLYNHGNEFLHYQDDWYILSSKIEKGSDDYVFVYYRGSNDAWDGYGGAVVYTKSSILPQSIVPELSRAAAAVGLDFDKFTTTDNTCGSEPPLFARLEKKVEEEEKFIEKEVKEEEMFLVSEVKAVVNTVGKFLADIAKGEVDLFNRGAEELRKDKNLVLKGLGDEEKQILENLKMEAQDIERLFGKAIPIRKFR